MRISKSFSLLIIIAILGTFIWSCKKTTSQILRDQEVDYIRRYVERYLPGIKPDSAGVYYKELNPGKGMAKIKTKDLVKLFYKGYLIQDTVGIGIKTGIMFDTSGDYEPFTFKVGAGKVISGWDDAIKLMKDSAEAIWVIPSRLAYSGQAQSDIPAYSPLVFHVRIYKVYFDSIAADTIKHLIIKNPSLPD